jgi:hypothetical protein
LIEMPISVIEEFFNTRKSKTKAIIQQLYQDFADLRNKQKDMIVNYPELVHFENFPEKTIINYIR